MRADVTPSAVAGAPARVRRPAGSDRDGTMSARRRRSLDRSALARALGVPEWALEPDRENELVSMLVRDHAAAVRGLVRAILRDARDVEEVVCDTFFKAVGDVEHFRGDCLPGTWLCRIATNLCLDRLRRRCHDCVPLEDDLAPRSEPHAPEVRLLLEGAIANLTPYQQALFTLHLKGYTIVELAELMNQKRSTVSGHYNDAIKQLRREIGPHLDDSGGPPFDDFASPEGGG